MNKGKGIVTKAGEPITLLGDQIKVGDIAPDCSLVNQNGESVKLSDFNGKLLVLSIYPSIDTPVCAAQVRHFNKAASELSEEIEIIGVSKDLPFALGRFCAADGIERVTTLSDYKNSEFGTKYGFLIEEMMLLARGVVIIDKKGVVQYVEYVSDIVNEPDYECAMDKLKLLYKQ